MNKRTEFFIISWPLSSFSYIKSVFVDLYFEIFSLSLRFVFQAIYSFLYCQMCKLFNFDAFCLFLNKTMSTVLKVPIFFPFIFVKCTKTLYFYVPCKLSKINVFLTHLLLFSVFLIKV